MKLVLTGFMGSGKSTVAGALAKKLGLKVIEMDDELIKTSGYENIPEIFKNEGETFFRELEQQIAKKLAGVDDTVISTGGGVIMNNISMAYLKKNAITVFLSTGFEEIKKRLKHTSDRPLFTDSQTVKKLFELRSPLYEFYSDHRVETDGKKSEEIVREIMTKLEAKI